MSANSTASDAASIIIENQSNINGAYILRYICLAGLVILVRDIVVCFKRERQLIWSAPHSASKYIYLVNRYLSPLCYVTFFIPLSGFSDLGLKDSRCYGIFITVVVSYVISSSVSNYLIAVRVSSLWGSNQRVVWLMGVTFFVASAATLTATVIGLVEVRKSIGYNSILKMCVVTAKPTHILLAASATPLAFEVLAAATTLWNAMDRPRQANTPLQRELAKDGFKYFLISLAARLFNLGMMASGRLYLSVISILITWVSLVIILARRVLALEYSELTSAPRSAHNADTSTVGGVFGRSSSRGMDQSKTAWAAGEPIQLGQVEVEFAER